MGVGWYVYVETSCISLVIYLHDILRMHGTMNIKKKLINTVYIMVLTVL